MEKKKGVMNDMVVIKKTVVREPVVRRVQEPPREQKIEQATMREEYLYEPQKPVKNRSGCLLWVIVIICLIALVVGVGGLFTHATIEVTSKKFSGTVDTTLNLSQVRNSNSVFFGTATKTFTSEKIVPAMSRAITESKATGVVRFYNTNTAAKSIPAKTELVSTAGKKYITAKTVTIPAKGKNPGQIEVAITAMVAGAEGNSGLDDFTFSKPSKLLTGITIRSTKEISGGASGDDAVADPTIIASTTEALKKEFANNKVFSARLAEQVPETMIALPLALPDNPVSVVLDPKHEDGVHITASQTITILLVDREGIARALGNSLSVGKEVKLTLETLGDVSTMTSNIVAGQPIPSKIQVRITGTPTLFGVLDTETIKAKILGLSRKEVKSYFGTIPEVESFEVHMRPFWRRVLPVNGDDVEVVD